MSQHQFSQWDRESQLYQNFTESARELLKTEEEFQSAQKEWEQFFITSHGDIFDELPIQNPRTEVFVDILYFDFIVDQIIEFLERKFSFELINQEPRVNTDTLSFSFQSLHEQVVDINTVSDSFDHLFSKDDLRQADTTFLTSLYEAVIPRKIRLELGEYYTPRGLAELAIESLNISNIVEASFLDPGCGSGVFNSVCINRKIAAMDEKEPADVLSNITSSVFGIDLNPVAVKSTKLNYLLSLLPVLEAADDIAIEIPVFLTDALKLTRDEKIIYDDREIDISISHLVGNPPWITWDRIDDDVKEIWKDKYVQKLNLLPHDSAVSRLGHANDDISIPFVWVCIHHYLEENGGATFVLKRDIMKGPAGKLLRTLEVADRQLNMTHIHDLNKLRPFGKQVGANVAVYTLVADTRSTFPIEASSWTRENTTPDFSSMNTMQNSAHVEQTNILPLDSDDSTSAWIREDAERGALGECDQDIRHGVKDDAQDVFSITRDQLADIEPDFVYPYLKSKHIVKYGLFGHELRLVPINKANEDNEELLKNEFPQTYQYLSQNRDILENRSSSWLDNGTFYNIFGIGDYTWAEYKLVWCRLGFKPHFAVVSTVNDEDLGEKMVIPGDHFMFIGTNNKQEAHFLCALLNSSIYQKSLKDIASEGKASLSKSVVSKLEIPEWTETEESQRLADLSIKAHNIVPQYTDVSKRSYNKTTIDELEEVQAEIDTIVENMLSDGTLFPDVGQSTLSTF
jgi:type I restriction-modification system DNA methylase subunit